MSASFHREINPTHRPSRKSLMRSRRMLDRSFEQLERRVLLAGIQWVGGNGDWDTPANWDLDRIPNSGDQVSIPSGAVVNVNTAGSQAQTINSQGTLRVNNAGSLTVLNGGSLSDVEILGGTLDLGYSGFTKTISGTLTWTAGTLAGQGATMLSGEGSFSGDSTKTLRTSLNVTGNVTHSGSGTLHMPDGNGDLLISTGGVYDLTGDADITAAGFGTYFQIQGTLRKSGAGESLFDSTTAELEILGGTIDAQAGTFRIPTLRGTSRGGTINAAAGATVRFEGANNYWGGKFTGTGAGRVEFASGVLYSFYETNGLELDFAPGLFHFVGGILQSSNASYPLTISGTMQASGDATKQFWGTPILTGKLVVSGTGQLSVHNAALNIESTGTLELADGATVYGGTITNRGTIRKLAGAGTASFSNNSALHHIGGTVDVIEGRLNTLGSGNSENTTFKVAAGAVLDLTESAVLYWKGTMAGTGGGQVLLDSGGLQSSGGELDLDFAEGMFQYGAAYLAADGGRVRNIGFLQISGDGNRTTRALIENAGTVRQTFSGALNNYGFGNFKNLAGALWEISGTGTIDGSPFENLGTIRKTGNGTSKFNTEVTNRPGAKIEVPAGTLILDRGSHLYPGSFDVTAGGVLQFSGPFNHRFYDGTFTNNGTGIVRMAGPIYSTGTDVPIFNFQGNTLQLDNGASFGGAFTFAGETHLVATTGAYFRSDGTTAFRNTGTWVHSGSGVLGIYVTTSLSNEGVYDVTGDGDFQIYGVNVGSVQAGIINSGTFRKSGGTGLTELFDPNNLAVARFSNPGTVEALSGTLKLGERIEQFTRQGTSTAARNVLTGGKWLIGDSGTLELPGGTNIAVATNPLPPIQTNAAEVTLAGAGSNFAQFQQITTNTGTLNVLDGRLFSSSSALVNSGTLRAGNGGAIAVNGTLDTTGTLAFGIEGTSASGKFGRITSTGIATLAGTAALELDPGFAPAASDVYTVMTFPSRNGDFAAITGAGTTFTTLIDDTSFKLNASAVATPVNLAVVPGSLDLPASAPIGTDITVSYAVINDSTTAAVGSWTDSLFLSRDQVFDESDMLLGRVERTGGLAAGDTYTQQATFAVPGLPDDEWFLIALTDSKRVVPQTDRTNDLGASVNAMTSTVPELIYGQTFNSTITNGQSRYFRLPRPKDTDAQLMADFTVPAQAELFVSRGKLPTRSDFGITSSDLYELSRTIDLSLMVDQDYYILVYGREGAGSTGSAFTLRAEKIAIQVQTASPNTTGNTGVSSFVLSGLGFSPDTSATLIAPDGTEIPAGVVFSDRTTSISAAFDLAGVPAGKYDIRVNRPDGATHTLSDAITVNADAKPGRAYATVAAPGALRAGRSFEFVVEYGNDGGSDVPAPWLTIGVTPGTKWNLKGGPEITARHWDILGASPDGLAGVLRPGQRIKMTFQATWESGNAPDIQVWGATDRQRLTPDQMIELYGGTPGEGRWVAVADVLAQQFGNTIESYSTNLATLASRKSQFNMFEQDVDQLIKSAVFRALLDTAPEPAGSKSGEGDGVTLPTDDAYVDYDKDPSTNGDGARLPDGRWTPWVPAREPTILELTEAQGEVEIRKALIGGWFGFREEWYEWISAWQAGTGKPWVATYDSRIAKEMLEFLQGTGSKIGDQTAQIWEKIDEAITYQSGPFTEIPQGTTTIRYLPDPKTFYVDLAEKVAPKFGDVKWSFGGTTLALGRTPAGNDVGFDIDLTRYNLSPAGDIVTWSATDIPMRIEDNFTIDEHVVNRAAKRNGKPAFKHDLGLYDPFYIVETFGNAKGLKWYVNMIMPEKSGKVALAGVEANAGPSQTVYIPTGQTTARVKLTGDAAFIKSNQLAPADGKTWTWTGFQVDPPDEQSTELDLPKGTYFFDLTVRGKGEPKSPYPDRRYEDTDLLMVTVLDESDKPTPVASTARPRPVQSSDPNDITGPAGFSLDNYTTSKQGFPYTIRFENISTATAPAQDVFVTQQLDSDLDWSTFELGSFGFGGMQFEVPEGVSSYSTRLDLQDEMGLFVDVDAGLNPLTGEVHWTFRSIDPETGDLVSDPFAGFLPPNASSPEGEGFVRYLIQQKSGLPSGREINAQARIVFDVNAPIDTNVWKNVIDADAPTSKVNPLAATQTSASFNVNWSGSDPNGSGIAMYDVYVSENGGPFTIFRDNTTATSASFTGINGSSYAFYSVASDNVGYVQPDPGAAQASTKVSVPSTGGNRAPTAALKAPSAGARGQSLSFKLTATDPDSGDNSAGFTYKINFGDGTSKTISPKANNGSGVNVDYTFKNKGTYKVTLTATDRKGKVSSVVTKTVSIAAVAMLADPTDSSRKALFVGGTSGKDTIRFDKASAGKIKLMINGVNQGLFNPSGRIFAFGQAGDDLILIAPDVPTNVIFFGNDGNDILHGGSGINALLGGAGKDSIYGHGGRDIVIGGSGKDLIKGDGSGDIFIGGTTSYDGGNVGHLASLSDLLTAWNTSENYEKRVAKIRAGVGASKALFSTTTVKDDNAKDDLHGGTGIDWFFARTSGNNKDQVHSASGEVITKV